MEGIRTPVSKAAGDTDRPTVLLADDDAGILKAISRTLASDFEVVATVTNGRQALETVPRLDPDVVVLDISMPGLDGFQTAAELNRCGSRAKIVFLTMHQDDGFVARAIGSGAMGYVLKTLAWSDLIPALRYALAGRQFLPSLAPLVTTGRDTHAVQFHGDESSWLDGSAGVLSTAFARGDTVATALIESNRDALALGMNRRGWDLADLAAQGRYLAFSAEEAATRVMKSGELDLDSVVEMVAVLEKARMASPAGSCSHLTIVGEMAVVLWRRGSPEAALALERLWDELTRSLPILTVCTYPMAGIDAVPGFVSDISAHHSVISHAVRAWRS